jgi:hypothetical protein
MARWDTDPEPYPPERKGEKYRLIDAGPVSAPAPPDGDGKMMAAAKDGTRRSLLAGLGVGKPAEIAPDENYHDWRPVA